MLDAPGAPVLAEKTPVEGRESVIAASTLKLLAAEACPEASLSDELVTALQREAEAFLEEVATAGCEISKLGKCDTLRSSDVALYISRAKQSERGGRRPDPRKVARLRGAM